MTCKDCYNYNLCLRIGYIDNHTANCNVVEKYCLDFKDKNKIIELPCKVGEPIFTIQEKKIVASYFTDTFDICRAYSDKLFGKRYFLSKADTENELKNINWMKGKNMKPYKTSFKGRKIIARLDNCLTGLVEVSVYEIIRPNWILFKNKYLGCGSFFIEEYPTIEDGIIKVIKNVFKNIEWREDISNKIKVYENKR